MTETAGRQLVLASRNRGKLAELAQMVAPLGLIAVPVSEFGDEDVAETAPTFVENALLKARAAARISKLPAIADDSGLEVDALHGAPGVRSARYAGEAASDEANVRKLLEAMHGLAAQRRSARFRCVAVYLASAEDPSPIVCEGVWQGRICEAPRGDGGFGYDPVFLDANTGLTAAELPPARKNALSHRAQAMAQLVERLRRQRE